ncbi:MAG TPA: hypothetical protein PLU52_01800 [Opitutaceae bacterium]|nr:hypothetical protein [Opitutaceae bacterium]HND63047.1 hypothetical protein [Opitutaceae bacterium]
MKRYVALAVLVVGGWLYFRTPAAAWRGMPAAREPVQSERDLPRPFLHGDYTITPLARYHVTAVVLSRDRYRNDRGAELSPVDLALGWGPMSVASVLNELKISQSGRWYEFSCRGEPPLEQRDIERHSANTHCLPADDAVRGKLLEVKRHQVVTMDGYLVEVTAADGYHWRSSLTRDDTGGGACEVMWITSLESRNIQ